MTIDLGQLAAPNLLSTVMGMAFMLLFIMLWTNRKELNCTDLICAYDGKGEKRLSATRIGQVLGILVAVWAPVWTTLDGKLEPEILLTSLAYLGAVEGFSKYLKWKSDQAKSQEGK